MRVALLLLLLVTPRVVAHPLPNLRYDRTLTVHLEPAGVVVRYELDVNEWTMVLDGRKLLTPDDIAAIRDSPVRDFAARYAARKSALLADDLRATLDGNEVRFRLTSSAIEPSGDHLKFRFAFRGDWSLPIGRRVAFAFEDQNFENEVGQLALTLSAEPTVVVHERSDPGPLRDRSPLDLKPGEERKLRLASAVFELTVPPPTASEPAAAEPTTVGERPGLARDLFDRGLIALFDSGYGLGVLLLAAGVFGAGHAFTPGHGKTLVAAYLVGERGTIRHAVALGITTTLAHTGSVIAVAAVLAYVYRDGVPAAAQGWLQLVGGLLILLVGLWLLSRRVAGRADHVHLFGDHHHGPNGEHTPAPAPPKFGWGRVILLGIGGGLVPCWDAVMLLFVAIAAGRLLLAVPLLLAFSVGLALVLVLLGVGVVLAHRAGAARFGERRWFRLLPVLSAALLAGMGLWLARDGVRLVLGSSRG